MTPHRRKGRDRGEGGVAARRAIVRWAWRLLRREWRQQLLVFGLIAATVAITTVGVGVSTNTPLSSYVGFGDAKDLATFTNDGASTRAQIASWRSSYGAVDVIENQTVTVRGSIDSFDLRAQDPRGPYGRPLLSVVSGRLPSRPSEVALTPSVATEFHVSIGEPWRELGVTRRVVGIVENPRNLLDSFALVIPGQVRAPSRVTVLFDAKGAGRPRLGANVITRQLVADSNALNPQTISIVLVTMAMMLISLVAISGFTVIAQRRLRSIGMLSALGATDRHVRLVVRANGVLVGVIGAITGFLAGFVAWVAYRPTLQSSAHHVIGVFQLPWAVIIVALVLAVAAAGFAASRPARAVTRISTMSALAGRPATPRPVRRSAVPGVAAAVAAFLLLGAAGASGGRGGGMGELALGFVALTITVILLSPFLLTVLDRLARRAPFSLRMAMRDLARYRARSGAALSAISLGVLIAMIVVIASAARFGNVLDYAGPNVTSTQLIVYTPNGPYGPGGPANAGSRGATAVTPTMVKGAHEIATDLGARRMVTLETTSATLQHAAPGRAYSGPLYVATPALLAAFAIPSSALNANADILTMRPGFAAITQMQIIYGDYFARTSSHSPNGNGVTSWPCPPDVCLANPRIEQVAALPAGTSTPNTVLTEHAVRRLGLTPITSGWLLETTAPLSAAQITGARALAAALGLSIETKSSIPTSATILNWATLVGVILALGILAMSIGLIRSETASDLRILMVTGASGRTRRNLTASTAGALALAGAIIGTAAAYLAMIAYSRTSHSDGLSSLSSVPVRNLVATLVAMPLVAALVGWIGAGREPTMVSAQVIQ